MKYRTKRELASLSMAEVLAELDALHLEPVGQRVFLTDGPPDRQGVPVAGEPPHYLTEAQQQECRDSGSTTLSLQQQVEQGTSLALWRHQLYAQGVQAYVESLGMAKAMRELKSRKQELTVWQQRNATRAEVEHALSTAIHNEQEGEAT